MAKTVNKASISEANGTSIVKNFNDLKREYQDGLGVLRAKHQEELQQAIIENNSLELFDIFMKIANSNIELGDNTKSLQKPYYYNDAAVACHYALSGKVGGDKEKVYKKLELIQQKIVKACGGNHNPVNHCAIDKDSISTISQRERLDVLRESVKSRVENKENTQSIFQDISVEMQKYLRGLYETAESEMLEKPPCNYAVMGLGSMALRQITPWSDLEFAIIIEKYTPENLDYFRNLSHLVNFKMINLGETIIPTSKYNIDLGGLGKPGVNFDLGGKTPLNRIDYDKQYDLIGTVEHLINYLKKEKPTDKTLTYILEKICLVHASNDNRLVEKYQNEVQSFLQDEYESHDKQYHGMKNHQVRALKLLSENIEEFNYNPLPQISSIRQYRGDLEKLTPHFDTDSNGSLLDVKQEIYRLPDRMIYNLGLYFDMVGDSIWDTVSRLHQDEDRKISDEGAKNLKIAINFATTLRLKSYSSKDAQGGSISTHALVLDHLDEETKNKIIKDTFFVEDKTEIYSFYQTIMPLINIISDISNPKTKNKAIENLVITNLYSKDPYVLGQIHAKFLEYNQAITYMEEALLYKQDDIYFLNDIYFLYSKVGLIKNAINIAKSLLTLQEKSCSNPLFIAISYDFLGNAFNDKGEYDQAIEHYKMALKIRQEGYTSTPNHPHIAHSYNNLGNAFNNKGDYDQALEHYNIAFDIMKRAYASVANHPDITAICNNLGNVFRNKGDYDQAIEHYNAVFKIMKQTYISNLNHPHIADSYNNLGCIYYDKGDYDRTIEYHNIALKIQQKIYASIPNHPKIAVSYTNLGNTFNSRGEYDKAIEHYNVALKMRQTYTSTLNHLHIASIYDNLGSTFRSRGEYDKAIEHHSKSLEMRQEAYASTPNHPDIANSYHNLGNVFINKGDHDQAIEYYNIALKIKQKVYTSDHHHSDIAVIYDNLGSVFNIKEEHDKAIEYHNIALRIREETYASTPNHPDIAASYNNLGSVFRNKGEYEKAIEYYNIALRIREETYASTPNHPDIAASYNNLGNVFSNKGEYEKAIEYYNIALRIREETYASTPNHPDIAQSYHNLGVAFSNKGDYDKAIEHYNVALEIRQKIYASASNHPDVILNYKNLCVAYCNKGEYEKALGFVIKTGSKLLCNLVNILFANQFLLEGNHDKARDRYAQINQEYQALDFASQDFIELQLRYAKIAYNSNLLAAAVHIQKTLVHIDSNLQYGNYYHNLACFYSCQGKLNEANDTFNKVITHPCAKVTGELCVEYAQFLILNKNNLSIDSSTTSKYLYAAIECNNIGGLQYGKIEKNSVCAKLLHIIKAKNTTITVNPKVLANYLLIINPEYIREDDSIENLLNSLKSICNNDQDEVAFELLADAYKFDGNEELALEHSNNANTIIQINKIIDSKLKLDDDKCTITKLDVQEYVIKLDELASQALFEKRVDDLSKFYTKIFDIYSLILPEQLDQLQVAANNIATFCLLTNNMDQFIMLKLNFGTELNLDIIKSLGLNTDEIIDIEQQIIAQIILQQQKTEFSSIAANENTTGQITSMGAEDENTTDSA